MRAMRHGRHKPKSCRVPHRPSAFSSPVGCVTPARPSLLSRKPQDTKCPIMMAATSQGFELKVALFVITSSLNCYLNPDLSRE